MAGPGTKDDGRAKPEWGKPPPPTRAGHEGRAEGPRQAAAKGATKAKATPGQAARAAPACRRPAPRTRTARPGPPAPAALRRRLRHRGPAGPARHLLVRRRLRRARRRPVHHRARLRHRGGHRRGADRPGCGASTRLPPVDADGCGRGRAHRPPAPASAPAARGSACSAAVGAGVRRGHRRRRGPATRASPTSAGRSSARSLPGMVGMSMVLLTRLDQGSAIALLLLVSAYETGDYLIGSGLDEPLRGARPRARAAIVVITFIVSTLPISALSLRRGVAPRRPGRPARAGRPAARLRAAARRRRARVRAAPARLAPRRRAPVGMGCGSVRVVRRTICAARSRGRPRPRRPRGAAATPPTTSVADPTTSGRRRRRWCSPPPGSASCRSG